VRERNDAVADAAAVEWGIHGMGHLSLPRFQYRYQVEMVEAVADQQSG
jgi:hypothetical protein